MFIFLCLILALGFAPSTALSEIGPGALPDWHAEAQVQLGWVFNDPTNPQNSTPIPGWDKAIGDIPVWSYDPDRMAFGHPGQWYIRIPNLINDNPVKNFWISWVYEFDPYLPGNRSATNIDWFPDLGNANYQYIEEWFDSSGNLTTDYLQAAYARVTLSLDLYPNPQYEDVWLGIYGGSKNAVEVYIKTLCVAADPVPEIKANASDGPITIPQSENLSVTVELDAGDSVGENADWWVVASTPFSPPSDWYYYDLTLDWQPGLNVTYQGPLFDLSSYTVLNISGLPVGNYTFYFGVDMIMNGSLDMGDIYYDSVEVTITP
jgi:hypothetical protein